MSDSTEQLQQQVAELTRRVYALESRLAEIAGAAATPLHPVAESLRSAPPAAVERPRPAPTPQAPVAAPGVVPRTSDGRTLENRIGSQVFNRIGIVALFAGVALFFKFAVDQGWLGPAMRVILGLVAGSGIFLWSESFRRRNYLRFSYTLKAVATGVLYLTVWAAFSLYHFIPANVAFVGMVLITLLNAWFSLIENAELLAFYALSGAFATPLLLSTGADHEIFLFSYLLLLNLAVVVLVIKKRWMRLLAEAYPMTVFYGMAWYSAHFSAPKLSTTLIFTTLFWILYGIVPPSLRATAPVDKPGTAPSPNFWTGTVLPILHAAVSYSFFYVLLSYLGGSTARYASAWTALGFSGIYLALTLVARKVGTRPSESGVSALLAMAFCTLFVSLYFDGRAIIYGWLVEGTLLVFVAMRSHAARAQGLAVAPLSLAVAYLAVFDSLHYIQPATVIFNARFACFVVGAAVMFGCAWWTYRRDDWRLFARYAVLAANLLALVGVSREIATYWHSSPTIFAERFSYSVWFMAYGAALLAAGFWRDSTFFRWQGLALLTLTIAKVFVYDMSTLSQGYIVLSLLGLGALLLGVSYAYQRDWLRLRQSH